MTGMTGTLRFANDSRAEFPGEHLQFTARVRFRPNAFVFGCGLVEDFSRLALPCARFVTSPIGGLILKFETFPKT